MITSEITEPKELKPIPGFPGYSVTCDGLVFDSAGNERKANTQHTYAYVCLLADRWYKRNVHMLVALAWIGPKSFPGAVVRHLDDQKQRNHYRNLAWGTRLDNASDAQKNGLQSRTRLTVAQVLEIRERGKTESVRKLREEFKLSDSACRGIVRKYTWQHV